MTIQEQLGEQLVPAEQSYEVLRNPSLVTPPLLLVGLDPVHFGSEIGLVERGMAEAIRATPDSEGKPRVTFSFGSVADVLLKHYYKSCKTQPTEAVATICQTNYGDETGFVVNYLVPFAAMGKERQAIWQVYDYPRRPMKSRRGEEVIRLGRLFTQLTRGYVVDNPFYRPANTKDRTHVVTPMTHSNSIHRGRMGTV